MFQHFGQRLKRDLKHIVDRRLEASAVASGSQVRVRSLTIRCLARALTLVLRSPLASRSTSSPTSASGTQYGSEGLCWPPW